LKRSGKLQNSKFADLQIVLPLVLQIKKPHLCEMRFLFLPFMQISNQAD